VGSQSRVWIPKDLPLKSASADRGVPFTELDVALGCRTWLINHPEVPIIICGWRAACLLSLGMQQRSARHLQRYRKETQSLIEDLQQLAVPSRQVSIAFDHDLKPKTRENVNLAIKKLGKLFTQAGCQVKVIGLPAQRKVDDLWWLKELMLAHLYDTAAELERWNSTKLWELTLKPSLVLNQRYLGELPFQPGFVIKFPKAPGRLALQPLIHDATGSGRRVLVITHRIQLGCAICADIGIGLRSAELPRLRVTCFWPVHR